MKPHPRLRKTIKWGGAAVVVLLVVVWIGSGYASAYHVSKRGTVCLVAAGNAVVELPAPYPDGVVDGRVGWHVSLVRFGDFQGHFRRSTMFGAFGPGQRYEVPLWTPLPILVTITVAAWRLDSLARRRKRMARCNLCPNCNYDRAGIAKDAVCPECGAMPAQYAARP